MPLAVKYIRYKKLMRLRKRPNSIHYFYLLLPQFCSVWLLFFGAESELNRFKCSYPVELLLTGSIILNYAFLLRLRQTEPSSFDEGSVSYAFVSSLRRMRELLSSTAKAPRLCRSEPARALITPKADSAIMVTLMPMDSIRF